MQRDTEVDSEDFSAVKIVIFNDFDVGNLPQVDALTPQSPSWSSLIDVPSN